MEKLSANFNTCRGTAVRLPSLRIMLYKDGILAALSDVTRKAYQACTVTLHDTHGVHILPAHFKGRGYGSWRADPPKRNYRIKFIKKLQLFDMPASRHFCLIAGVWNNKDGSMLKSDSAFSLARAVLTNMEYSVRTRPVEVYVNNGYHGVFTLSEKVRPEKHKINISCKTGDIDTGYLLNYVWFEHTERAPPESRFQAEGLKKSPRGIKGNEENAEYFIIKSPSARGADPTEYAALVQCIKGQTQKLADALIALDYEAFSRLADVPSFVDNLILQELYKNTDYGAGGCYLYKKRGGGKLYAGPPWDFDWAVNGGCEGFYTINGTTQNPSPFITYLYAMPKFKELVICRWQKTADKIKTFLIDFFNGYINEPSYKHLFGKNFALWDAKCPHAAASDWKKDAECLRDWLFNRADWLSGQWC
ncbi:MAG: CotH kinase family protein [Firmicutes bacterium]|nr:CotH kinase family protein [Bacillota bacterium]